MRMARAMSAPYAYTPYPCAPQAREQMLNVHYSSIYHLEPICDIIKEVGDSVRFTINKISLLED
ncbi:hypothetical protein Krac_11259 [Ktedonobacter racemifer DSM 44963]|uniref:Uncharacterized protein n=1 Tax=Ktedonobacter racemifer DSM 44963 TaxID=485913 RepID=D6TJT7_KTERA|nr:hypothetical protein Krac_11259 [Ktedonobacter racemifer DSM 44963]